MNRISGIFGLLIYVCVATTLLNENFVGASNMENIVRWTALRAILGIGVVFVIITGGIDLSLGSVVGLVGCLLAVFLKAFEKDPGGRAAAWTCYVAGAELLLVGAGWLAWRWKANLRSASDLRWPGATAAAGIVTLIVGAAIGNASLPTWTVLACVVVWSLAVSLHIGLIHGLLITEMKLQPFVVTLCGLLIYRGLARAITDDQTQGFGTAYNDSLRLIAIGKPSTMAFVVFMAGFALAAWAAWRLFARRDELRETSGTALWAVFLAAGSALALIGASRWLPDVGLGGIGERLGIASEKMPARLMSLVGWLVVPCGVWLFIKAVLTGKRQTVPPIVAILIGALCVWGALALVKRTEPWGGMNKLWASRANMTLYFIALGGMMMGLAWFARAAVRAGGAAVHAPLAASMFTSVLWLMSREMGKTSLAETLLGNMRVPSPFFITLAMGVLAGVFLNQTIYGRYLLALGRNEQAARFSGIKTERLVVLAYVLCAGAAGLGGVLFALDVNSVQPSGLGSGYELFAIAAAVLGGCSLRGGEGTVVGVVIGAAVMQALFNATNILGIPSRHEPTILGFVILIGVMVDEIARRMDARRRAKLKAA
ncbi:MAG TPA: hypothetical protein PLV92_02010 [Pirellulaceae bacterium]|nr:hypothetical protein [Pirellulaceae bacterium]